ncbi:hypothetical protein GCM10017668_64030 [Streptomyces tuirus]|uniref:Uncharacterized protein n=1 Tax=Streptomyces tuirus TaxID=68278 RepID=A0A7G1NS86_9ACTN|nr:hypothetical protein GCM10017668_64030 [Streptomyces tuirus]
MVVPMRDAATMRLRLPWGGGTVAAEAMGRHFLVCGGDGWVFAHGRNVQVSGTCGGTT